MSEPAVATKFVPVDPDSPAAGDVAVLTLNRPEQANALSPEMLEDLSRATVLIKRNPNARAALLMGKGKHFSAGADLGWMKASAALDFAANVADSEKLLHAFEALATLEIPTIALVHGAAYGGAVGLVAACDFAIACDSARFCLSEVKLGLLPAVITPYLARKIPHGDLRRLALSARIFDAEEALRCHLVTRVCTHEQRDLVIREELNPILQGGKSAQGAFKRLLDAVVIESMAQGGYTARAIAAARTSAEGQAGLAAFFAKQSSPWASQLTPTWTPEQP